MLKLFMAGLLATQAAATPPAPMAPRCLTRGQVGSMGVVGAAVMVNVARNACRRHLRSNAFLLSASGTAFVATMREHGRQRLPSMIEGFSAFFPRQSGMPVALFRTMASGMLNDDAGLDWADYGDPQVCREADEIASIMAELTPDQIGRFTVAFASFGDQMSRIMLRGMRERPAARLADPPAGGSTRPRPLSFQPSETYVAQVPVVVALPPPPPGPPPPPRPPLICPEPE